jgi:hypothetical protein
MDAQEATGALGSFGFSLPTPAYLLGAILFGIYGWVAYRRGKTTSKPMLRWTGLALMLYPYTISQTWMLWVLGVALSGWAWIQWE